MMENYQKARNTALNWLAEEKRHGITPSEYYKEEMRGLEYMLEASPLIVKNLRHHCHHVTGVKEYEYRSHHRNRVPLFEKKLADLKKQDKWNLLVPEDKALGGFGFEIGEEFYNADTLKYYECMLAMKKGGAIEEFADNKKKVVVEIGGGWGGLACQFKKIFPNAVYVTVDLPLSIIFSITYLRTVFPSAKIFISDGREKKFNANDYDFAFFPYYLWNELDFARPNLVINTVGFQEMSTAQISNYAQKTKEWGCPYIYSMNRDRSPYNFELSTVSGVLGKFCNVAQINVLDVPHYEMRQRSFLQKAKSLTKRTLGIKREQGIHEYKHLVGRFN